MSKRPAAEFNDAVDGSSMNGHNVVNLEEEPGVPNTRSVDAIVTGATVTNKLPGGGTAPTPTAPAEVPPEGVDPGAKPRTEKAGDGGGADPTTTAITTNTSSTVPAADLSKDSGGLGTGAKAGIAVGVVLVFVLAGIAVFLLMRRKRRRHAEEKGEIGEGMIEHADKKLHDSNSYSPGGASGGGALHHDSATPPLVGAPLPHPPQQQPLTVHTPRTTTYDEDLVNRPVSPVDDLLDVAPPPPGSSRGLGGASSSASGAIGGSGGGAGVDDDDDREMAWILEEERKARERREAAQRLPTSQ